MNRAFAMTFTAGAEHIDVNGHVNNSVWVEWMEDIATAHWQAQADPADVAAYVWVVTRHEIDYRGNIGVGETAVARTWIDTPPRGARFDRNIEFVGDDGRKLVTARTTWAMIDATSGRIARVPQRMADRFLTPEGRE